MYNQENNQNITNQPTQLTQEQNPRTVLFVSDLPENISDSELQVFFSEFKTSIVLIQINSGGRTNESKPSSTATVIFKDPKQADEARNSLNLRKLKGKTVRIMWHERDSSQRYSNDSNLFIKNIPLSVKPREFYELFLQFGEIVSAKLMEDENGNHFGYGYIHYSEPTSAEKALNHCEKNKYFGETLDVKYFQKKTERHNPGIMTGNKNVYVNNIPLNTKDNEIKDLFKKYGDITYMKLHEENERMFATISFQDEDSTTKAINGLNGTKFKDSELFVNNLMKKSDREKVISRDRERSNYMGGMERERFTGKNNLHIRNIPYDVNEEYLTEVFSKFGEVSSVKIQKYTLVQAKDTQEQTMSKGFGYVCFKNESDASTAKEAYNGKRLPKYETWNRPLLIEFFMPKTERQGINKIFNPSNKGNMYGFGQNKTMPFMGNMPMNNYMFPMMYNPNMNMGGGMNNMGNMNMGNMPMYAPNQNLNQNFNPNPNPNFNQNKGHNQNRFNNYHNQPNNFNNMHNQQNPKQFIQNVNNQQIVNQNNNPNINQNMNNQQQNINQNQGSNQNQQVQQEEPDIKYMNSLEDDMAKKDYLGEFIFKKIENHEFTKRKELTIDTIGKITGMILGIEEINEIVEISKSNDQLTLRISEALELLTGTN